MTLEEFRREMDAFRRAADDEARAMRDSYLALDRLHALYQKLDVEERAMADQVLAEWTLSDDENMRFDALHLIRDFEIVTAIPAMQKLTKRRAMSRTPGAPFELQKVERLIAFLTGDRTP